MKNIIYNVCIGLVGFLVCGCSTLVQSPRLAQVEQAVLEQPGEAMALQKRAFVHATLGNKQEAVRDYEKAIALSTNQCELNHVHWSYGWSALNLGMYPVALEQWGLALRVRDAEPWWAPHTLAIGYWVNHDRSKALASYDRAASASPGKFGTWDGLVRYTSFWTWEEKNHIYQIFDAWNRAYREKPQACAE